MIKKIGLLALSLLTVLTFATPCMAKSGDGLTVTDSSFQADFPLRLTFEMSVESDVKIHDIRLRYQLDRIDFARVISEAYINFTPDTSVSVDWTLEMLKIGGLPPGSSLEYWWVVKDIEGKSLITSPEKVTFDDHRYSWKSITEGKVTLYWYEGNEIFASELMMAAQDALDRLKEYTTAEPEKMIKLYIYADSQDLQGSMIYPQEWTGGVAFTRYGIMAIGIAPEKLDWGKRAIAHELTHLVIHQVTLNPYNEIPTWLDEGLAMRSEGGLSPTMEVFLNRAVADENLISVQSLASPFSAYSGEASLSYAQSYSLVDFLISQYGQAKMDELLQTFAAGSTYDTALEKVYGFDMDGLDVRWQNWIQGSGEGEAEEVVQGEMTSLAY